MYSTWTRVNGNEPSNLWVNEVSLMSNEQLRAAILACRENIRGGDTWAPDYAKFVSLANGYDKINYEAAFDRMLKRKPEGDAEYWTAQEVYFNCRCEPTDKAMRRYKSTLDKNLAKEREGKLPPRDVIMIAKHSAKGSVHILMEKNQTPEAKARADAIMERIKRAKT